jgi:tetratricopeptide (TPR) repeat protein
MPAKWEVNPSRDEVALLMEAGFILREARRLQEAREVFTGVRALQPSNDAAEVALGTIAFHEGNYDTARKHYRKALEMNPKSAFALAHLGETEVFAKNQQAARQHLKRALELDPRGSFGKLARGLLTIADNPKFK